MINQDNAPQDLPAGQSDGGGLSSVVPASQMNLVCDKLVFVPTISKAAASN